MEAPTEREEKKPKWLRRLEQESWQAELVISGVAIFGSLQLPGWINGGIGFAISHFSQEYLDFLRFVFTYALVGSQLLIFNFILHFSMRTLWIGMVGLASVFPAGLNPETDKFSQDYFSKLKRLFPDINAFNRRLDDQCSTIFAIAAITVLSMASISIFLLGAMGIGHLAHKAYPAWPFPYYVYTIMAVFLAVSLAQGMLSHKAIREKEWVKRVHFPVFKGTSILLFNLFFKPANYIFLTFYTNSGQGRFWGAYIVYVFILVFASANVFLSSDIMYMDEDFRHSRQTRTDRLYAYSYDNLRAESAFIPFASLEADVVSDGQLLAFVPVPEYEEKGIRAFCGSYEGPDSPDERRQFRWDCLKRYYHFFVNDSLYSDVALFSYTHPGSGQEGIRVYLPTAAFREGENLFRIERQSPLPADSTGRSVTIPFQFYPKR
ncbi:MAG: hypothetical protein KDD19_23700 [Phaeodactylibacter sp.]|nr:hypothetical protein [Phaeodactylibacter sp.]MCB9052428.1 hypothetical protein [Lewinellaceae bacterium]